MNGWQTPLKKEGLRFWKVSFQTVAAPVLTAVLYLLIFGHVLEGRVLVYDRISYTASAYQTAADLVKAAKASPGRINYASPGVGTPHHMAMELFKSTAGVSITHIPYRGTGPALTDLLGGQVECMFLPIHVALVHVKAGKLRALGIGSHQRHPLLPDVPTLKEAKAGDVNVDMWYGVFAPAGMPADQVDALNREIRAILASEEVRHAFAPQGMDPAGSTPAEFKALVQKDARRWADLVKARGITAE